MYTKTKLKLKDCETFTTTNPMIARVYVASVAVVTEDLTIFPITEDTTIVDHVIDELNK